MTGDASQDDSLVPTFSRLPGANLHPDGSGARTPGGRAHRPVVGQSWGKYLIEKRIGRGGQAEVFQAYDRFGAVGHVALKVAREPVPPSRAEAWTAAEAEPLVKIDHDAVVRVVDAGCVDGLPYVATELVEGLPLDAYVKSHPPSPRQVLGWATRLAEALACAHDQGVVHRDIKPANIIVARDGRPRIIDFGISTLISPHDPDRPSSSWGTPSFMAPEQAGGRADCDHRVDVFALGGILKFLLEGAGPYGEAEDPLQAARAGKVVMPRTAAGSPLRRALARIARRALAPDPDERYRTAREMATALRRLLNRRKLLGAAAGAAAVVGAGAWGLAALLQRGGTASRGAARPVSPSTVPAAAAEARLDIHFQRAGQKGSFQSLTARSLPLRTGDRIQIHVRLSSPQSAYLVAMDSSGEITVLYPPEGARPEPTTRIDFPPGRNQWVTLQAPTGTETFLLLARRKPPASNTALKRELASLGGPPSLEQIGLLVADARGVEFIDPRGVHRAISTEVVTVDKGILAPLLETVGEKWTLVRAVCFSHAPSTD